MNYAITICIDSEIFFYSFRVALISRLCKVKTVISHSHNVLELHGIKKALKRALNPVYTRLSNVYLSCSNDAKKSLFSDNFIKKDTITVLKNGIEIDEYKFNDEIRRNYRKNLNLDGKVVYGHVGRFRKQKNHDLLIDIFYNIQKQQENSVLMLIGDGDLKKQIENKVNELNIQDKVFFYG